MNIDIDIYPNGIHFNHQTLTISTNQSINQSIDQSTNQPSISKSKAPSISGSYPIIVLLLFSGELSLVFEYRLVALLPKPCISCDDEDGVMELT
mmetsp:Transcript_21930/g.27657  ORF Transcript_21930/g.27657 Transcript_21930/m.27657 type:complete len:94 (+) Transcript_21930:177-458(+)